MPDLEPSIPLSVPDDQAAKLADDLAQNRKLAAENAALRRKLKSALAIGDRLSELLEVANAKR